MNSRSLPRKLKECSSQTEPLRRARRSANRVATSNARKARSRSVFAMASRQAGPSRGAVTSAGRLLAPTAYWDRSLSSASSTGCSLLACQGRPLTPTRSDRTGAMASIRRWRMTDARLGARCARLTATRSLRRERNSASGTASWAASPDSSCRSCWNCSAQSTEAATPSAHRRHRSAAALEHENELIRGREQAVAQKASHLHRARRLLDSGADRRRASGHASCIAAHEHVVELAQISISRPRSVNNAMRSSTSLMWRVECLAGALHSQL